MNFEIKNRFSGVVLFSLETESMKLCVEAAVKSRVNLSGADLRGAKLPRAELSGANLYRANLSWANLSEANLSGAELFGVELFGAELSGVNFAAHLGQPDGWWAWTYINNGEQRVRVGCRDVTIAEGRAYWADKPQRAEVLAALDYAEAIGRSRKWGKQKTAEAA